MPVINLNDISQFPFKIENQDFEDMLVLQVDDSIRKAIQFATISVHFINCKIQHTIVLSLRCGEVENFSFLTSYGITFEDCYFKNNNNQNKNVITVGKSQSISLKFINCIIDDFKLSDSKFNELILSKTIILAGKFLIENSQIDSITINNSLGKYVVDDKGSSTVNLSYCDNNLFIKKDFVHILREAFRVHLGLKSIFCIEANILLNDCKFINCEFQKSENISGIQKVDYHNIYSKEKKKIIYYLNDTDFKSLNLNLEINQQNNLTKAISIKNSYFNKFIMKGVSDSFVNIENLHSNFISLEEFNSKEFKFYDITFNNSPDSVIQLYNSNFTNTHFDKVNFKNFKIVNLYRCYLEEIKFSSTNFSENIESVKNIKKLENKEIDYFEMQYEIFRQLKSAYLKNSNQVQAIEMHRRMHDTIYKFRTTSKQDKFILLLNKISNNHDTSIWSPFKLMAICLIVLWFLYCFFLPNTLFIVGWNGYSEFIECVLDFLSFTFSNFKVLLLLANPLHNINNLSDLLPDKKLQLSNMNYLISYLSRIIIAWLTYQFVNSFRKFGRKL